MINKKTRYGLYILALISFFSLVGCTSASDNATKNKQIEVNDANQADKLKDKVDGIKKVITADYQPNNIEITAYNVAMRESTISNYSDNDLIAKDLHGYIIQEANKYLKSGKYNKDFNDRLYQLAQSYHDDSQMSDLNAKLLDFAAKEDKELKAQVIKEEVERKQEQANKKLTSEDGMLELESHGWEDGYVIGVIKNLSSKNYSYVEVSINLYDEHKNQVGSTFTNVTNLLGNSNWNFKAVVLEDKAKSYTIVKIRGE